MSLAATVWAVHQTDVPLDERMVLLYLADSHCPDTGCLATPERLAEFAGIDLPEMERHLAQLETRGKIRPVPRTDRWLLAFEPCFLSFVGGQRR